MATDHSGVAIFDSPILLTLPVANAAEEITPPRNARWVLLETDGDVGFALNMADGTTVAVGVNAIQLGEAGLLRFDIPRGATYALGGTLETILVSYGR